MSITTVIAIYFVLWWICLFIVLPFGVYSQHEHGEMASGTDPGAPALPRVAAKLGWTTLLSGVIFAVSYALNASGLVTFATFDELFP